MSEEFGNEIRKAREYAFLGMYQEALNYFQTGIQKVQERVSKSKNDKMIQVEWNDVVKELQDEIEQCKKMKYIVSTGRGDFQQAKEFKDDDRGKLKLIQHFLPRKRYLTIENPSVIISNKISL